MMDTPESSQLISELRALGSIVRIDAAFRASLGHRLRALVALHRPPARGAWWRKSVYTWGASLAVIALLIMVNVTRPTNNQVPVQVAFDAAEKSGATNEHAASAPAPMLMAGRSASSKVAGMSIHSSVFDDGSVIPVRYTCDGADVRPALSIANAPADARSLVVIVDDSDAPAGVWTHWVLYNIPPNTTELASDVLPAGALEGKTSAGSPGWRGPCPPSGTHSYTFTVYALDATLSIDDKRTVDQLRDLMEGHVLGSASLIGTYGRE